MLKGSDQVAVVANIDPDAYGASTVTSGWVDAADFEAFLAIIQAGALGASATIDAKIEQATDSGGTGAKDVAGTAITQITQAGTDQSDTQALINVRTEDLDVDNAFRFVRVSLTVGTATSDAGAVLLGVNPRFAPASENDAASVGEIVG